MTVSILQKYCVLGWSSPDSVRLEFTQANISAGAVGHRKLDYLRHYRLVKPQRQGLTGWRDRAYRHDRTIAERQLARGNILHAVWPVDQDDRRQHDRSRLGQLSKWQCLTKRCPLIAVNMCRARRPSLRSECRCSWGLFLGATSKSLTLLVLAVVSASATEGSGTLLGQRNLRYFLESGFTSVRDLNGVSNAPFLLARWSEANAIPAPRVFTAGHIITGTGGHATERPITPNHGPEFAKEVDGTDAWRAAVRRAFKAGASVIKIASHFSADEVAAAVDEAHLLGLKITCDCETIYIDMAIEAGVDMIEYPLPRTDASIRWMARENISAVPTLQVYQNLLNRAGGYYGSMSRRFTITSEGNFDVFRKMKAAGVVMGVGTDSIGQASEFAPNMYIAEFKWFVKGGYSVLEALKAATITNATLLDMDDKLGSLEAGKLADIIVVDGRPDENLDDLANIDIVIKDGLLLIQSGLLITPRHISVPNPPPMLIERIPPIAD